MAYNSEKNLRIHQGRNTRIHWWANTNSRKRIFVHIRQYQYDFFFRVLSCTTVFVFTPPNASIFVFMFVENHLREYIGIFIPIYKLQICLLIVSNGPVARSALWSFPRVIYVNTRVYVYVPLFLYLLKFIFLASDMTFYFFLCIFLGNCSS